MSASEDLNRLKRAVLLADLAQASGINSQMLAMASQEDWGVAAEGIRRMGEPFNGTPSEETQKLTIALLVRREEWSRRLNGKT
jgi:hypothetical protein